MKTPKRILLLGLLLHVFFSVSFSQERPVFLSKDDSCQVHVPQVRPGARGAPFREKGVIGFLKVRFAYIIPSNRTPQPNGVANLQNAIKVGQQWYKQQMEQNGFGAKTFVTDMELEGEMPNVYVVHVEETDDYLRQDLWGRTIEAASKAGISVWEPGEVWVLIPETHQMAPDGTVIGGVALGAGSGSGYSPGVAMLGSDALPFFQPEWLTDDRPYDGIVSPALGPFPMKQGLSAPWFEGNTLSSVASSRLGALLHEMGHAFGLAHDYRNDNNFHGNLMFNGLRGIRGSLYPEKYPNDYTRLEYVSALILNFNLYFNWGNYRDETKSPTIDFANPGSLTPQQGLLRMAFQAFDPDSIGLAQLRYKGDCVAEMPLAGLSVDTAFAVPYFTKGDSNPYTIAVHDRLGNITYVGMQITAQAGFNQAPIPFIRISPPAPGTNQSITLDASLSEDVDHPLSSVMASWDVDNDGEFDTKPTTSKTVAYTYKNPGNYLIRLKLTDPDGGQTISTPVSIKVPEPKTDDLVVSGFTLIDATLDQSLGSLANNDVIDLSLFSGHRLSMRADIKSPVEKVILVLSGPIAHSTTEHYYPYNLFGDILSKDGSADYAGRIFLPGNYHLTAIPFAGGIRRTAYSIDFTVIRGESNAINGFTLIDATLDQPVVSLANNDVIDLSLFSGHRLSMRADIKSPVEKVILVLSGPMAHSTTEHYYPYNLFGDILSKDGSVDYAGRIFLPGTYHLMAIPFAGGIRGSAYSITFTMINGASDGAAHALVEVYPIPASGIVNVRQIGRTEGAYVTLLDSDGNVLLRRSLSQQPVEQLDVSTFRKGIHYLKIVSHEGTQTIRLVVE